MNPGILLSSGMNPSCTRRAASLESVTPSYRRTVKYALLLMVLILRVTYVSFGLSRTFLGKLLVLFHRKVALARQICGEFVFPLEANNARARRARCTPAAFSLAVRVRLLLDPLRPLLKGRNLLQQQHRERDVNRLRVARVRPP